AGRHRAGAPAPEPPGPLHAFAVAAQRLHDPLVARRQQLAAHGPFGSALVDLQLGLRSPAWGVTYDRHDRQTVAQRRVELERVIAECTVAERRDDGAVGV